jgi:CRISPR system Cascade subunit CasC
MKRMKIEIHLLQNFAPANLNRDDTGAPKDCELGGYRRARVSSQCQKRAVRDGFRLQKLLSDDLLGARTKRLAHEVASELVEKHGHVRDAAAALALGAIEGVGLGRNKKGAGEDAWKTEYLLFVPRRIVSALAQLLHDNREKLAGLAAPARAEEPAPADATEAKKKGAKKESKRDAKQDAKAAYPKDIGDKVAELLESARSTADIALFGRMIADKPDWNVDASCQVAHAISTNRLQADFDFFTAIDDFKPGETAGSDMMGTVQFNSSCFYRYAVLDVSALRKNLGSDGKDAEALAKATVDAFIRAFVSAIPTGKQNSMAAHNFPSYALAVVRDAGQSISLTNAFLKPARPREDKDVDLVDDSIAKLEGYYDRMREPLGPGVFGVSWADRDLAKHPQIARSAGLEDFFGTVTAKALEANA